jgi:cell division septal protein FtsQ
MSNQRYISDTLKRKKQKVIKVKIYIAIAALVLVLIGIIALLNMSAIQINQVKVTGNVFVDASEIEKKADTLLKKRIAWVIPRSNIFLFSKKELEQELKQNPAIVSVKIRKDFFKTLSIDIVEQEKQMLYCVSVEKTECYYVNGSGFVYAQVEDMIIPEQEIIIYTENQKKQLKDTIIEEKVYKDIVLFVKNLARQEVKIREVYIKSDGVIEFVNGDGTKLITSIFDEFSKDFANLIALFDQQVLTKEQLSQIDYIDLRFGNKVFYKNKTN